MPGAEYGRLPTSQPPSSERLPAEVRRPPEDQDATEKVLAQNMWVGRGTSMTTSDSRVASVLWIRAPFPTTKWCLVQIIEAPVYIVLQPLPLIRSRKGKYTACQRIGVIRKFCLFRGWRSEPYREQLPLQTAQMPEQIPRLQMGRKTATPLKCMYQSFNKS